MAGDQEPTGGADRASTVEALVGELTARILRGELLPGRPLREVDLSAEFGVGRNSVRTALQALAHDGLAVHRPNRGAVVREFGLGDIEDLYGLRAALECEAARVVAASGAPPPAQTRTLLAELERFGPRSPWDEIVATDMAFHRSVVRAVGNTRAAHLHYTLTLEVRLLQSQVHFDYPEPGDQLGAQHRELVEALESGDPERADAAFRKHLRMSRREVVACYRGGLRRVDGGPRA